MRAARRGFQRAAPSPDGLPSVAVVTMARDEGTMLRRWVDHYGAAVGAEHVLVWDDRSEDGSTDDLPCRVELMPQWQGDGWERARMEHISDSAAKLLADHEFVVFTDVDEFVVPDPAVHAGLREFLAARRDRDVLAPVALNVLHAVGAEPALDDARPVLEQRHYAKFLPVMCKPSVKQVPAAWRAASHGIQAPFAVDPEVFMLHLKFADQEQLRRTAARRHLANTVEGRAKKSSWRRTGDELADLLPEFVGAADPSTAPEFDASAAELDGIVQRTPDGTFRATGAGQIAAMSAAPLVRIPRRLAGLV